ncbi:hypothetical protein A5675_23125 [Mycobacterium malmoense]|uniref:DUF3349 domain-containing protein n=1 Tax=Mycobacterium malmoense TaxID=1780 RepID=UPI00080AFFE5|nr:DUF3349 domain-containing protein [Mycobacterium malmoense]OCB28751.1 hypothetical protein A5674_15810 [Mycobacterium malmoense]OCB33003.1 hypothetical protein A5675_23125 [Mycobacterium malmoense]OCB39715.1 hypothetical protein A5676_12805 [Mycobacterium malmoense]
MGLTGRVASIVAFLRAGYPSGAPAVGYAPLLALLPRRVSDEEVTTIARKLLAPKRPPITRPPITDVDVGVEITRVTDRLPSWDEIDRVRRRLSGMGWAGRRRA